MKLSPGFEEPDENPNQELFFTLATLPSAGISCRRVSVCLSFCHKSVFYWKAECTIT